MKYRIETWIIRDLIELYKKGNMDLNPPYQRNDIWSLNAQKLLIDSIKRGFPLPNFFMRQNNGRDKYEMVDGQQRSRTILGYYDGFFPDVKGEVYIEDREFLHYKIPVVIIEEVEDEDIREFYVRVNTTGLRVNRPESYKAEFFDTNFLKLAEELANLNEFEELEIFTSRSKSRMIDRDFIEELVAQILLGITEKKKAVDKIYQEGINDHAYKTILKTFQDILKIFNKLNKVYPIKGTRYKQKNDFYTLFGFVHLNKHLSTEFFNNMYQVLVSFDEDIIPSNEDCEPFQVYAFYCISQSNSKDAREKRLEIINAIFLNPYSSPNSVQSQILRFYKMTADVLMTKDGFLTFDSNKVMKIVSEARDLKNET